MTTVKVVLVRHGERLDEVKGNNWYHGGYQTSHGRHYDCPLTDVGAQQAHDAAKKLIADGFVEPDMSDVDVIHTSTLLRCVGTAKELAEVLSLPVKACNGLAECAAAIRENGYPLASLDEVATVLGDDVNLVGESAINATTFRDAVVSLCKETASATTQPKTVLVCTHREGIRDLFHELPNVRARYMHYCAQASFEYNLDSDTFTPINSSGVKLYHL
jgi:broad specificity phosphatase PhoE